MTDKEKTEKMNELMNKISFALKDATLAQGFEIICKRIAELEKQNDCYKALESHYEEIEEDAKIIAKENEELKAKLYSDSKNVFAELNDETARSNAELLDLVEDLKAQIEKMKCCGNCINRGLNKDDFSFPCCDCKYWRKIKENDYWVLEK